MNGVAISPNLKKTRVKIDAYGNEADAQTGEILGNLNDTYKPTQKELDGFNAKPVLTETEIIKEKEEIKDIKVEAPQPPTGGMESKIEAMISKKIEALVEKKVNEVLEKLLK